MIKSIVVLCALIALGDNELRAAEENAVYNELATQGVKLSNGKTVKFSPPVMADGLTADEQKKILAKVLTVKAKQKEFENGDPRDWFQIDQTSEAGKSPKDSIGRQIDLYFVAKGKLATLASDGFMQAQLKAGKNGGPEIKFYTVDELKQLKLTTKDSNAKKERFAHTMLNPGALFGKVQVTGSGFGIETRNPDNVVIAFKMDPRFDKDPKYPNQYQTAKINPAGVVVLGPVKPYSGFAGYAKITKLQGPDDKVFVEYHLVYDEPYEWFNGTAELASKLETSYNDNIKKFRRNLVEYEKQQANPPNAAQAAKK